MFERFTDRARRVVVLAQEEARMLNTPSIGTEHLLLGLLHEDGGVAGLVLRDDLSLDPEKVREMVVGELEPSDEGTPSGHIPFTIRAKKVLELSLREALQLGHNYIGTEHVLLGLIREGEGIGAQVLVKCGADLSGVRQAVIRKLSGYGKGEERRPEERRSISSELHQIEALVQQARQRTTADLHSKVIALHGHVLQLLADVMAEDMRQMELP